jgi:hypothetical protein
MTAMQAAVQDRLLTAVAWEPDLSVSLVLAGCPRGANERDLQCASEFELLFAAHIRTGPPYALTAAGQRDLVPAWRRCRERERRAAALSAGPAH